MVATLSQFWLLFELELRYWCFLNAFLDQGCDPDPVKKCGQFVFLSISEPNFGRSGLNKPGYRMECIAKTNFGQKSFLNFGVYLCLGSSISGSCCPETRFESFWIFGYVADLEPGGWLRYSDYRKSWSTGYWELGYPGWGTLTTGNPETQAIGSWGTLASVPWLLEIREHGGNSIQDK